MPKTKIIEPNTFEPENCFYPKVLNAQLHPMVSHFFSLSHERWLKRYVHLHPEIRLSALTDILHYKPRALFWAGADLFYVATSRGHRRMVVIETNSCPSGQKSMPIFNEISGEAGYQFLINRSFKELLKDREVPEGGLAYIYDKNATEALGYSSAMADAFQESVYLTTFYHNDTKPNVRFTDGVMEVRDPSGKWVPIRAAMRYVTQKPWNRIPLETRTFIYNPVLACLSGGRNKLVACKAYELFNSELYSNGLSIHFPETILDVSREEVPLWIRKFGGRAVVKIPYSNAGQGVYTITSATELEAFMAQEHPYGRFIVQSLIGDKSWSSTGERGRFFHIGTVPNEKNHIYAADLRMMICWTPKGFRPIAIYARRAREPLQDDLNETPSWEMLGTNLSIKRGENQWDTDTKRLIIMDRKEFNSLGIGIDDLIDAFVQTVLAVVSIDQIACQLASSKGTFRKNLFQSLDHDPTLHQEILAL